MGYVTDAIKGFSWQTALKIATAGVIVVKISVLARLLTPEDFGVFSLVLITLGLSEALTQTGVNITLLQSKEEPAHFIDSAWVIAIVRGFLIGAVMVGMGYGLQNYFHRPELFSLVSLVALVPVIKGFINPAIIGLRRQLRFFHESAYQFSLVAVETLVAVALALSLRSVSALIFALIGAALFEVIISFLFFKLRPRLKYIHGRGKVILHNAKWLSLSSVMGYLNDNVDDFIVGSTTGTFALGLYHNAYALAHKLNYDVAQSVNHGLFPIFTKIADDKPRLSKAYLKTVATTFVLICGFSLPLLLFPRLVVNIVLGNQWLSIIPFLPLLVLAGIIHSISLIGYALFIAKREYLLLQVHQLLNLLLTIVLMATFSAEYGLAGAVAGLAIARLVVFPIIVYGSYQVLTH